MSKNPERATAKQAQGPSPEQIQTAYEIHTLAQMFYGQLATAHPWIAMQHPMQGYPPMIGYEPMPGPAMRTYHPMTGFEPTPGPTMQMQTWPWIWHGGPPPGWGR